MTRRKPKLSPSTLIAAGAQVTAIVLSAVHGDWTVFCLFMGGTAIAVYHSVKEAVRDGLV